VLANVQDPDNDPLNLVAVGGAGNGAATIVENRILYTPNVGYVGEDRFTYTVSDGFGGEVTGMLQVMVGGSSSQPVIYLPLVTREDNQVVKDKQSTRPAAAH
jgi:hypothetical protein